MPRDRRPVPVGGRHRTPGRWQTADGRRQTTIGRRPTGEQSDDGRSSRITPRRPPGRAVGARRAARRTSGRGQARRRAVRPKPVRAKSVRAKSVRRRFASRRPVRRRPTLRTATRRRCAGGHPRAPGADGVVGHAVVRPAPAPAVSSVAPRDGPCRTAADRPSAAAGSRQVSRFRAPSRQTPPSDAPADRQAVCGLCEGLVTPSGCRPRGRAARAGHGRKRRTEHHEDDA